MIKSVTGFILEFCRERLILTILLILPGLSLYSQEPPPRPITVTAVPPGLSFGTFAPSSAGTVTVTSAGGRSASAGIILLNITPFAAAASYEIVGNQGTLISILNGSDVTLTGGGGSITLHIGSSSPASPFVLINVYPVPTVMTVGGTLTMGLPATCPPGLYTGTFFITFNQE